MSELPCYIVYECPSDFPDKFVVRIHRAKLGQLYPDDQPYMVEESYKPIEHRMNTLGLVKIPRSVGDDPVIKETWI